MRLLQKFQQPHTSATTYAVLPEINKYTVAWSVHRTLGGTCIACLVLTERRKGDDDDGEHELDNDGCPHAIAIVCCAGAVWFSLFGIS